MRGKLRGVVQRRKLVVAAAPERAPDQAVREVRVFRQKRAVQVGADHPVLQASLGAVAAVVSKSEPHPAHRSRFRAEVRAAAVVLESNQRPGHEIRHFCVDVDDDIADEALLARFSADVDEPDAREALALGGLVVVAEQLVAAAYGQHDGA